MWGGRASGLITIVVMTFFQSTASLVMAECACASLLPLLMFNPMWQSEDEKFADNSEKDAEEVDISLSTVYLRG